MSQGETTAKGHWTAASKTNCFSFIDIVLIIMPTTQQTPFICTLKISSDRTHIHFSVLWWESDLFWFAKILVHLMYWGTQKWWLKARRGSHFQVTLSSESVDDDDLSRKPSLSLSALKSRLILPSYLWPRLRGPNVHGQPNNHFQQCHPMLTICKSNHLNSQPHSKSWSTKQALTTMSNCPTPNFNNNLQEVRYGLLLRSLWANSCATILFNLQRTPRWSRLETRTIFISTLVDCLTNMSQHFY